MWVYQRSPYVSISLSKHLDDKLIGESLFLMELHFNNWLNNMITICHMHTVICFIPDFSSLSCHGHTYHRCKSCPAIEPPERGRPYQVGCIVYCNRVRTCDGVIFSKIVRGTVVITSTRRGYVLIFEMGPPQCKYTTYSNMEILIVV